MDTIWLGSQPIHETGTSSARRYQQQIERHYGKPPRHAELHIRDGELYLTYRISDENAGAYALAVTLDPKSALLRWDRLTPKLKLVPKVARNVWTGLAGEAGFTEIAA